MNRVETRIIPEDVPSKFYAQHLAPYEFLLKDAAKGANKIILEVGCGDGYGAFYLAGAAAKVIGVDYDIETITKAQNKYKKDNLSFARMDATRLDFDDAAFDIICSFQVIEHIPEEEILKYLSEISRVLKKDGKFYLSTLNLEHSMKSKNSYEKNLAHCKEFKLYELEKLLLRAFSKAEVYGLQLTLKHRFYQRLKKIGIPVNRFYEKITTKDFKITRSNLRKASDFICICEK